MPSDVAPGAPASVRAHARTQHVGRLCMVTFFYIDEDYGFEGKASRGTAEQRAPKGGARRVVVAEYEYFHAALIW